MEEKRTISSLYAQKEFIRQHWLDRGRKVSELTLPYALPQEGHNGSHQLETPHQSLGARGVKNVSSKFILTMFPPNSPFFRLQMDRSEMEELAQSDPSLRQEVEADLADIERATLEELETSGLRTSLYEVFNQLTISGNVLLYVPKKGKSKVYTLDQFVVERDHEGNLISVITKETIHLSSLPEKVRDSILEDDDTLVEVDLYSMSQLSIDGKKWEFSQEVQGKLIEETMGSFKADELPYIAPRMFVIDGEPYGRGLGESYLGDLLTLEHLTQSIIEASMMASRVLYMIRPGSGLDVNTLIELQNGSFVTADPESVGTLQMNKSADLRVAQETVVQLIDRLSFAFLLNSAVRRSGERVTAQEIRFMARELEDALGGAFSTLSQELQLPLAKLLMMRLASSKKIPSLPADLIKPKVVTGIDALGRGHDLTKLREAALAIQELIGPEQFAQRANIQNLMDRVFTAAGVDADGLIKSPEELAQEQQAAQLQGLAENLGPEALKQLGQQQQPNQE